MSWVDFLWPMMGAMCFTLALIHLLIGIQDHKRPSHLWLSLICVSVGAMSIMELMSMRATNAEQFATILRWGHVPFATMIIGIVWFVRLNFKAGDLRLAYAICALRLLSLVANFLTGDNLHFEKLTALEPVSLWGGTVISTPVGDANPWLLVGQISLVLLIVFLLQVIWQVWHRGDQRERNRVLAICGSMFAFMIMATCIAIAVTCFEVHLPISINPAFLPVLLVMSIELGGDILRAAHLADRLEASDASLKASQLHTSLAVRAADLGIWTWDPVRRQWWISDIALRLLGLARAEDFDPERFLDRVNTSDRERLRVQAMNAAKIHCEFETEFQFDPGDGTDHWLAVKGQSECDYDGKLTHMTGVVSDITERKLSDLRFQQVVDAAPVAMVMAQATGCVVLSNLKAQEVFGRVNAPLVGRQLEALLPQLPLTRAWSDLCHGLTTAYTGETPLFARQEDGREIPVELAVNPVLFGGERFLLASIIDISERKQMERESALQRDELAHLSRVAMLAELSGSLAHELNQPLTAILSNAQAGLRFMAQTPPDLEEVSRSLSNIVENDKRAGEVIRRLRAMLRKDTTEYHQLEINEVVQDVLRIIRSDLLNRNIELTLELTPDLPLVEGDRVQLQQVLLNLVMNGSDAMSAMTSGREMTVRTKMHSPDSILVSVSDVGSGIPESELEHIFTPFVTTKPEGMGLGLAVCATIIHSHRGKLWASNNEGRGATLNFSLPLSSMN